MIKDKVFYKHIEHRIYCVSIDISNIHVYYILAICGFYDSDKHCHIKNLTNQVFI